MAFFQERKQSKVSQKPFVASLDKKDPEQNDPEMFFTCVRRNMVLKRKERTPLIKLEKRELGLRFGRRREKRNPLFPT